MSSEDVRSSEINFEFDRDGSPEINAAEEIISALEHSPDLIDYLRSLFGDALNDIVDLFGPPRCSMTADANNMIVRLEPSVGLSKLLFAVRAFEARHNRINVG